MPLWRFAAAVLLALPLLKSASAQTIALSKEDATVWAQGQVVAGTLEGASAGTLYVDGAPTPVVAEDGAFAVPLHLGRGTTTVVACVAVGGGEACPDTLRLTLGYVPRPETELTASVAGGTVSFTGRVLENPEAAALTFAWAEDSSNPAPLGLAVVHDSSASASVPPDAPPGDYYVDWTVTAAPGETRRARTFLTVGADGAVRAVDIADDQAGWIERAVIYEISPYYFQRTAPSRFVAIQQRLPELADLGVNTLWLQPITVPSSPGQAYDVVDYFGVWSTLGTEEELRALIASAHALGMRVIFDLVPNHTSLEHPYAQDAIAHGARSHYFDFYQRVISPAGTRYRNDENVRQVGQMTFIYYFWNALVNLDYDNPEVRRFMTEAGRYWVENFDIDGYRIDAVWGVNARRPTFFQEWRLALKRVRPEALLLGEDKATLPASFDRRFDAAFDWLPEEGWVSHWTWQPFYSATANPTIFNEIGGPETARAQRLRAALTNNGQGWAPNARVLRFMENNDTHRFVTTHDRPRTRMAAALLFSLPGIPLIFNGQEVGIGTHPYSTYTVFGAGTIQSHEAGVPVEDRLFPYYRHLTRLRTTFPALYGDHLAEIGVAPVAAASRVYAYHRSTVEQHVVGVINMGVSAQTPTLSLPVEAMGLDLAATYYATDLVTGEALARTGAELAAFAVPVPGYTTRLFVVADSVVAIPTWGEPAPPVAPGVLALEPNVPNPFSRATTIAYHVGQGGPVRLRVFDVLGREVATLVDGDVPAGRHVARLDGTALASGVYVVRLESAHGAVGRRMTLSH